MVAQKFLNQNSQIAPIDASSPVSSNINDDEVEYPTLPNFYNQNLGELIMPKNELLQDCKLFQAVDLVIKNLKKMPNYKQRQNDYEFIKMACIFIENLGIKEKDKFTKKDILIQVFTKLFNIDEAELLPIFNAVEFLLNNKLIKKIKLRKKAFRFIKLNLLPNLFF